MDFCFFVQSLPKLAMFLRLMLQRGSRSNFLRQAGKKGNKNSTAKLPICCRTVFSSSFVMYPSLLASKAENASLESCSVVMLILYFLIFFLEIQ